MSTEMHAEERWLHRLELLSDGIFAIAMTLLALEIHAPKDWDRTFAGFFNETGLALGAYFASFAALAGYWASHRRIFHLLRRADRGVSILNFVFLAVVCLVPPGTQMVYEFTPQGPPLQLYLALLAIVGLTLSLIWGYASLGKGMVDPAVTRGYRIAFFLSLALGPAAVVSGVFYAVNSDRWQPAAAAVVLALALNFARQRTAHHLRPAG